MFFLLLAWPDQLPSEPLSDPKREVCRLIRSGEYIRAEATLLGLQVNQFDADVGLLLVYLHLLRANLDAAWRQLFFSIVSRLLHQFSRLG